MVDEAINRESNLDYPSSQRNIGSQDLQRNREGGGEGIIVVEIACFAGSRILCSRGPCLVKH